MEDGKDNINPRTLWSAMDGNRRKLRGPLGRVEYYPVETYMETEAGEVVASTG